MKIKKEIIRKISQIEKEKPKLFSFALLVIGMITTILGTHLINSYKGNNNFLNLNEDYENMLGV